MIKGFHDPLYRYLAYRYSVCLGKPKDHLVKSPHQRVSDALFILQTIDYQGSGFLLEGFGLITNAHVVEGFLEGQDLTGIVDIFRYHDTNIKYAVYVDKISKKYDIAILKFKDAETEKSLQRLKAGSVKKIDIGTRLTICGFPEYIAGNTPHFSHCIINGRRVLFSINAFLVNTPIVHGNSGGPVINEKNEVVGIATFGKPTFAEGCQTIFHGFTSITFLSEI